ncbi:hypothetical protein NECAME_13877 [Necator americanus]|uniref:Uncharacterized protein n=1 Tax=Necator americanus TaxID=51031 RepID=W2SRP0_NECAM|nr:hypothetical protein NECAME_13877 [Necator americanus]ETN72409.1 hypothetical protein NECAME_13877 [Necator americanus]
MLVSNAGLEKYRLTVWLLSIFADIALIIATVTPAWQVFLYRISAKIFDLGREFLVACCLCCSTLTYQLKNFERQPLSCSSLFNELVVFLVDVFHCGIFTKAGERSEEIPCHNGVQWVESPSLDRPDDIALKLREFHHQILDDRFRYNGTLLAETTCMIQECHESVLALQKQGVHALNPSASLTRHRVAEDTDVGRYVQSGLWIYCPGAAQCWYIFSDNLINYYERV